MWCNRGLDDASEAYYVAYDAVETDSGPDAIEIATAAAVSAAKSCLASLQGMHRDQDSITYISETHMRKNHPELFQNGKFILEPKD